VRRAPVQSYPLVEEKRLQKGWDGSKNFLGERFWGFGGEESAGLL